MKTFSAIVFGVGFLMVSGAPGLAQMGDMGDAMKKAAGDAAQQQIMKSAGLPTPGAPAAAPAADTGAANAPAVAPGAADAPAVAPGSDAGAPAAPADAP